MTHRTSIKSDTVSDLPASKCFTVKHLAPKNESRADLYRRIKKEAAARERALRKKMAWKLEAGSWYRRLRLTSEIAIALYHDDPNSSYTTNRVCVDVHQSGIGCRLNLPAAELRKLANVLIEASMHIQRLEKQARDAKAKQWFGVIFK